MNFTVLTRSLGLRRKHLDTLQTAVGFFMARVRETHLQEVASMMTLTTLLSLVPLVAVSLAVFAVFPSFADARATLESMLIESFLPQQYSEQLVGYIRTFSSHASGLGIFGVSGLAVTSLMLINKFFVTVNQIFNIRHARPWSQRALLYWALLTLGPACIAFSLTTSTQALRLAADGIAPSVLNWVFFTLQLGMQVLGYTFLFKFVPNCPVRLTHAAIGGTVVALAGLIVREIFEHYVSAGTLGSIYGAFVAIPVLILWVYVAWYLVFTGAAITATMPLLTSGRYADNYREGNAFLTGVALLKVLYLEKSASRPLVTMSALCDRVDTYPQLAKQILDRLAERGYCAEISDGRHGEQVAWTLICDPAERNLLAAFDELLVDRNNELIRHASLKRGKNTGMLREWFDRFDDAKALTTPLTTVFAAGMDRQDRLEKH